MKKKLRENGKQEEVKDTEGSRKNEKQKKYRAKMSRKGENKVHKHKELRRKKNRRTLYMERKMKTSNT